MKYKLINITTKKEPINPNNQEVTLEQIEKQETLEEASQKYALSKQFNRTSHLMGFREGAKWQQKQNTKLYTEQEVVKLFDNYRNHFEWYRNIQVLPNDFFEWFEQLKKK